jgi:hypothetical protein
MSAGRDFRRPVLQKISTAARTASQPQPKLTVVGSPRELSRGTWRPCLIPKLRAREDATGRFLNACDHRIALIFASGSVRPLPRIRQSPCWRRALTDWARARPAGPPAPSPRERLFATPGRAALTIVLLDLLLVLSNPTVWKREGSYRGILDFVKQVDGLVPATTDLFAAPEIKNPVLVVLAYRLQRNIRRKPVAARRTNEIVFDARRTFFRADKKVRRVGKIHVALRHRADASGKPARPANLREDDQSDSD